MKEITDKVLESVAVYLDDDLREWTHYHYCGESNEEFLKQYFLRLCYEQGGEKSRKSLNSFSGMSSRSILTIL